MAPSFLVSSKQQQARLAIIVHPEFKHTLPKGPEKHCFWDTLPQDVLRKIASYLPCVQDLLRFERLSKRCKMAANDEGYWKRACVLKFSVRSDMRPPSWRELYKFNHDFLYRTILSHNADKLMHVRLGGMGPINMHGIAVYA